eukprot:1161621-Pelagomonas_calceolata.AAC.3
MDSVILILPCQHSRKEGKGDTAVPVYEGSLAEVHQPQTQPLVSEAALHMVHDKDYLRAFTTMTLNDEQIRRIGRAVS